MINKNRSLYRVLPCVLAFFLSIAWGCGKEKPPVITIAGSTTMAPMTAKLAQAYQKKNRVEIVIRMGGSHNGIKALLDGDCDIADSSAKITPKERELALRRGAVFREFLAARDIMIPIVHPSNPLTDITLDSLRKAYLGKIKDWKALGGKEGPIELVGRDVESGTHDGWEHLVQKDAGPAAGIVLKNSNSAVLAHVAHAPASLGYISYSFLNSEVKALSVNGSSPWKTGGDVKDYPLVRDLYYYVNEKNYRKEVREFLVFVLSREGQKIVHESRGIPVGEYK